MVYFSIENLYVAVSQRNILRTCFEDRQIVSLQYYSDIPNYSDIPRFYLDKVGSLLSVIDPSITAVLITSQTTGLGDYVSHIK